VPAVPPTPAIPAVPTVWAGTLLTTAGPVKATDSTIRGSVFAGGDLSYTNVNHQPI
jgi:hypothetical protein